MLSGTVLTRRAGETVTIFAQRPGETSFQSVATIISGDGGAWRYAAKPPIRSSYEAGWNGVMSPIVVVGVRPAVRFRALANGRFSTRVVGTRSFAHRVVQLQRRSTLGRWVTLKRVRLNGSSAAVFSASLPRGRHGLRVAMSVNQAGFGYLAGLSRTLTYRSR